MLMQRESLQEMRIALSHGPDHCPPHLFAGDTRAILAGLKAHANTIAHARHVAIEATFPRTRALIGIERFHSLAERWLDTGRAITQPQARIGEGFPMILEDVARNLAQIEWAWLEAHGAADAPAFDLESVAALTASNLASMVVTPHPAARFVALDHPVDWEGAMLAEGALLVRPAHDVTVVTADRAVGSLLDRLRTPTTMASLLEDDPQALLKLIERGALMALTGDQE